MAVGGCGNGAGAVAPGLLPAARRTVRASDVTLVSAWRTRSRPTEPVPSVAVVGLNTTGMPVRTFVRRSVVVRPRYEAAVHEYVDAGYIRRPI